MMPLHFYDLLSFLSSEGSPYDTFYPGSINSTSWITNDTIGTYGSIYKAPTYHNSVTSVYNYCFMPHPRPNEYQTPAPVQNGSIRAELVHLNYIQRHQRRTPYNILPGGENQEYNCNNVHPFLFAGLGAGVHAQDPLQVYAKSYTSPTNPFSQSYVQGTCQYPQLTIGGFLDGELHGSSLASIYRDLLGFFPATPDPNSTYFRSSESALTQQTASAVLRGIWPDYTSHIPLHQQASAVDTVNSGYACGLRDSLLRTIQLTPEWKGHLEAAAPLLEQLSSYTLDQGDWISTFDHLADNFQARLCNGYELPCEVGDASRCVSEEQADEVFRAGDWEWNYYWRSNPNVTKYIQTTEGLFIGEILDGFYALQAGKQTYMYVHNFVHDGDIGPIAGALGITALRWPGMGANIAFEIWKADGGNLFARVLYSGQPIQTIHGVLDWISLSDLIDILKPFVPDDIIALCNS